MRAIRIHGFGGIDTVRREEISRPAPGAGEVLVAVKAAGVGPWDRLVREGRSGLGHALPLIPGSDVSGTVAALDAGVGVFALGDAVYGTTNDQFPFPGLASLGWYISSHANRLLSPQPSTKPGGDRAP
jgi:NADPH:quinone reductase-like Zn-dependent oxidoreductase